MTENLQVTESINTFIEKSALNAPETIFDINNQERQELIIHENSTSRLILVLTKAQRRNTSRWVFVHIEFKNFDDVTKSGCGFKINDLDTPLSEQLSKANSSLYSLIDAALNTCSIRNHKNIEFEVNGYKLEIVKISTKYITIAEHINAVRFEKRFSNLDLMFKYISFRKDFHNTISIEVSLPSHELEKLNIEKRVLTENVQNVYFELIERLTDSTQSKIGKSITITNVSKLDVGIIYFDVTLKQDDNVIKTLHASYNDIAGVSIINNSCNNTDDIHSNDVNTIAYMYSFIAKIEQCSGYFKRYVELETQLKKFSIKTAKAGSNDEIEQQPVYVISSSLAAKLRQAKDDMDMITEKIDLTKVGNYERWVQLEGTMKNRRRCAMVIYASDGTSTIEEYRLDVEKERISDDTTAFFSSYFC